MIKINLQPAIKWCVLCFVTQLCLNLCDPMDCIPPGSSVHGDSPGKNTGVGSHSLFQGIFPIQGLSQVSRTAGGFFAVWAAREALTLIVLCNTCYGVCVLSRVWFFVTSWNVARSVPLSLGFPRQEYWGRLPSLLQVTFPIQGPKVCLFHLLPWH